MGRPVKFTAPRLYLGSDCFGCLLYVGVCLLFVCCSSQTITVSPSVIPAPALGARVNVSWYGIQNPRRTDIIAVYPGSITSFNGVLPVKYIYVEYMAPDTYMTGSGNYTFWLVNYRVGAQFVYFQGSPLWGRFEDDAVAAKSRVVQFQNPNTPSAGRLAFAGNSVDLTVTWQTRDVGQPVVQWGLRSKTYRFAANATTTTITAAELCGTPANSTGYISPGAIHTGVMSGLQPSTVYYYRYGDASKGFGFSPEYKITTAPAVGTAVKLLAIADLGHYTEDNAWEWLSLVTPGFLAKGISPFYAPSTTTASLFNALVRIIDNTPEPGVAATMKKLAQEIATGGYSALIFNGDLSYARGVMAQWDHYIYQMSNITSFVPQMVVPGNHERLYPNSGDAFAGTDDAGNFDSGGECGVTYEKLFPMPSDKYGDQWYAVSVGPIRFIQMSSEQPFYRGSPQWNWVVSQITGANRTLTPWLILGLHRPFYADSVVGGSMATLVNCSQWLRDSFEDLLMEYQVDMTWSGHAHAYWRTCPIYNGTCFRRKNKDGTLRAPVHITFGNAGMQATIDAVYTQRPYWIVADSLAYGYAIVDATPTSLTWKMVAVDGSLIDQVVLTKPAGWTPNPVGQQATMNSTAPQQLQYSEIVNLGDMRNAVQAALIGGIFDEILFNNSAVRRTFGPTSSIFQQQTAAPNDWNPSGANYWEMQYPTFKFLHDYLPFWLPLVNQSKQAGAKTAVEYYWTVWNGRARTLARKDDL